MQPTQPSPTDVIEIEWQFDAPSLAGVRRWLRSEPALDGCVIVPLGGHLQRDTYFDSPDWRVYRANYTLRVRRQRRAAEVTLKAFGVASRGPRARREITESLPLGSSDPLRGEGLVREPLTALLGTQHLTPLFEVVTRRESYALERDGVRLAAVDLDRTRVSAPARTAEAAPPDPDEGGATAPAAPVPALNRIEIELTKAGDASDVEAFVRTFAEVCNLGPAVLSKFQAGLLALELSPPPADAPRPPRALRRMPLHEFALAAVRHDFSQLLRHEPGTRLGLDDEALHQMRVATHRSQTALGLFEPTLPGAQSLRNDLAWVGDALGRVRDLDVELGALGDYATGLEVPGSLGPVAGILRSERTAARTALIAALDSDRYAKCVSRVTAMLASTSADLTGASSAGETPLENAPSTREFAAELLRQRFQRLRRDASRLEAGSPPAEFHALRTRVKRFRYAVDFFSPLTRKASGRMAAAAQRVQDLLGEHQDADVAIDRFVAWARDEERALPVDTVIAIGQIVERNRVRMRQLRRRFPRTFRRMRAAWLPLRRAVERRG